MTKDGVRDFIAAEYTLSENYVHGLAAFAPRLNNFESPHFSRGSSPGRNAGNSVKGSDGKPPELFWAAGFKQSLSLDENQKP